MKLTASMMVTLDGVYQGPGGPDEDRRGGLGRGGWTAPYADEEGWRFLTSMFERADALLLGRRTWEIWEPYWPQTHALTLVESRLVSSGVTLLTYRPAGRATFGTVG